MLNNVEWAHMLHDDELQRSSASRSLITDSMYQFCNMMIGRQHQLKLLNASYKYDNALAKCKATFSDLNVKNALINDSWAELNRDFSSISDHFLQGGEGTFSLGSAAVVENALGLPDKLDKLWDFLKKHLIEVFGKSPKLSGATLAISEEDSKTEHNNLKDVLSQLKDTNTGEFISDTLRDEMYKTIMRVLCFSHNRSVYNEFISDKDDNENMDWFGHKDGAILSMLCSHVTKKDWNSKFGAPKKCSRRFHDINEQGYEVQHSEFSPRVSIIQFGKQFTFQKDKNMPANTLIYMEIPPKPETEDSDKYDEEQATATHFNLMYQTFKLYRRCLMKWQDSLKKKHLCRDPLFMIPSKLNNKATVYASYEAMSTKPPEYSNCILRPTGYGNNGDSITIADLNDLLGKKVKTDRLRSLRFPNAKHRAQMHDIYYAQVENLRNQPQKKYDPALRALSGFLKPPVDDNGTNPSDEKSTSYTISGIPYIGVGYGSKAPKDFPFTDMGRSQPTLGFYAKDFDLQTQQEKKFGPESYYNSLEPYLKMKHFKPERKEIPSAIGDRNATQSTFYRDCLIICGDTEQYCEHVNENLYDGRIHFNNIGPGDCYSADNGCLSEDAAIRMKSLLQEKKHSNMSKRQEPTVPRGDVEKANASLPGAFNTKAFQYDLNLVPGWSIKDKKFKQILSLIRKRMDKIYKIESDAAARFEKKDKIESVTWVLMIAESLLSSKIWDDYGFDILKQCDLAYSRTLAQLKNDNDKYSQVHQFVLDPNLVPVEQVLKKMSEFEIVPFDTSFEDKYKYFPLEIHAKDSRFRGSMPPWAQGELLSKLLYEKNQPHYIENLIMYSLADEFVDTLSDSASFETGAAWKQSRYRNQPLEWFTDPFFQVNPDEGIIEGYGSFLDQNRNVLDPKPKPSIKREDHDRHRIMLSLWNNPGEKSDRIVKPGTSLYEFGTRSIYTTKLYELLNETDYKRRVKKAEEHAEEINELHNVNVQDYYDGA